MKKEGFSVFNSRDAKVNFMLLVFVVVIFIVTLLTVESLTITVNTPSNLTFNSSRNINFTFTVTWSLDTENISNCTIWTNATGVWDIAKNITGNTSSGDNQVANATLSYANFTFSTDGNFTYNIGCYRNNASNSSNSTGQLNFTGGALGSGNRTVLIDTVAPQVTGNYPGAVFGPGPWANYTSFPINISVIVNDTSLVNVWYIINSLPNGAGTNETVGGKINNITMTASAPWAGANITWYANISLNNFTSQYRSPGAHSVFFCANDSLSRVTCSGPYDFAVIGMNVTVMENMMSQFGFTPPGSTAPVVVGLNVTFGNGTEIPEGTFLNPLSQNFTMIFNMTRDRIIQIVGMLIDEGKMANASNSNFSNTIDPAIQSAAGSRTNVSMAWADISKFIPSFASYTFGVIQIAGTGYDKRMYCNGTTTGSPSCFPITRCNATVLSALNTSTINNVIPTGEDGSARACWLEGDRLTLNEVAGNSAFTYLFVRKFSGAIGVNDTGVPEINMTTPTPDLFNTTNATSRLINFTVSDINSTGINLTRNNTINLTIFLGNSQLKLLTYINDSSVTNLTCTTSDATSPGNTTLATCNATFNFGSNGTYTINVSAIDASNNTNFQFNATRLTVDQIPPRFNQYNITHNATSDFTDPVGIELGIGDGVSTAQGKTIYIRANWTDNLTQTLHVTFQFYNASTASWQTLNSTFNSTSNNQTRRIEDTANWGNFSFVIPISRGEFEGRNVSFRLFANDTLGNINTSNSVKNFTIQVNDSLAPTVNITSVAGDDKSYNNTNTSNTLPTIVWNVTESNSLSYVAIQFDGLTDQTCNQLKNFTTSANANRNGSVTLKGSSDQAGCNALSNGTHIIRLTAMDTWGNGALAIYNFSIESGTTPTITLNTLQNGVSAVNQSNVTPYIGLNFSAVDGVTQSLKNISFTSSCNSTVQVFTNATFIYPFNYTQGTCKVGVASNQTVTVTAFDFSGNSVTQLYQFFVDDLPPKISVNAPTEGLSSNNNLTINLSALDDSQSISTVGYYLDLSGQFIGLNNSAQIGAAAVNTTNIFKINFTVGTHKIKFTANDTLGNVVNSSIVTFTVTGPLDFSLANGSTLTYTSSVLGSNITNVSVFIKDSTGVYTVISNTTETSGGTFQITFAINNSGNVNGSINVSLTDINGSAANWNLINFTPLINNTNFSANIQGNWTNRVLSSVFFNTSINEFIPNNNSYFGVVILPYNLSGNTSTAQEFWWVTDVAVFSSRSNISQCPDVFSATTTTPCWNYTSNGRTIIFVPHFSSVMAVNDSNAPTINVSIPIGNQTVSMFVPNITVSSDALSCVYQLNSSSPVNRTMTKSGNVCIGQTERFKNMNVSDSAGIAYAIRFFVTDNNGNINTYNWTFNVSDQTSPGSGTISASASTTTATVTETGVNESVNATVIYGTVNTTLSSIAVSTNFNSSQSVSLTGLTAGTTYYYNISVCDFNGNCVGNGTYSFATSAAAAAAAAASSSSSGGSAGAVTVASNEAASASRQWDAIQSGATAVLAINNKDIAVTGVAVEVKNSVSSVDLKVVSLTSNPVSTAAASKVYQYLQITKTNIADSDTSKVTISFKVPKSWLTTNGVKEDDVVLYRYSSGSWNGLPTTKTGEDANNYLYQAVTPGFSTFAVGNKEAAPTAAPTPPTAPTEAAPPPVTPPTAPTQPAAPAPVQQAKKPTSTTAWIVVAIIVIIAVIGYVVWKKKQAE